MQQVPNPHPQDEELIAYEAGYRAELSPRLSIDFSAFYNDYDLLQTTEPLPLFFNRIHRQPMMFFLFNMTTGCTVKPTELNFQPIGGWQIAGLSTLGMHFSSSICI